MYLPITQVAVGWRVAADRGVGTRADQEFERALGFRVEGSGCRV